MYQFTETKKNVFLSYNIKTFYALLTLIVLNILYTYQC